MDDRDDYSHLPVGRVVGGYEILSVLGSGGFGVTYLARHLGLGRMDALKECLPVDFAWRRGDMTVGPLSAGKAEDFAWAKERFLLEAQTLAKFTHGNVVHVYDVFEANGTVYMPTGYIEGRDLKAWLDELGRTPTEAEMLPLLEGVLDGLSAVHAGGVLHRDLKPENIYVTDSGKPVLLDFGSARQVIGGRSRSMTSVLTPGYAPPEQYFSDGNQGAWTDVYGLCATLYHCLCGEAPPDGSFRNRRGKVDPYVPLVGRLRGRYSERLLAAIDAGLDVDEERRPQSVEGFGALLGGVFNSDSVGSSGRVREAEVKGEHSASGLFIGVTGLFLVGFLSVFVIANLQMYSPPERINAFYFMVKSFGFVGLAFHITLWFSLVLHVYLVVRMRIGLMLRDTKFVSFPKSNPVGLYFKKLNVYSLVPAVLVVVMYYLYFYFKVLKEAAYYPVIVHRGVVVPDVHSTLTLAFQQTIFAFVFILGFSALCIVYRSVLMVSLCGLSRRLNEARKSVAFISNTCAVAVFVVGTALVFSVLSGIIKIQNPELFLSY